MNNIDILDIASFEPRFIPYPSAWLGFLPFAAWIVKTTAPDILVELGTHYGHSFFSFCQSVVEANLTTQCYAIDSWQGDVHAGKYEDEVFSIVSEHQSEYYLGFSYLLRTTFDDAVNYFSDSSVNLLHIDGLHTYEAVRHDFETWLPKLAPGAIVLIHDISVRERNFGVYKFWEELQEKYTNNISFFNSNGLGVLQLPGSSNTKELEWLRPNHPERTNITKIFSIIGQRQIERFNHYSLKTHANNLQQALNATTTHADNLQQALNTTTTHANDLQQAITTSNNQLAVLLQTIDENNQSIADLNQKILYYRQTISEKDSHIARFLSSTSWKITEPCRWLGYQLKQLFSFKKKIIPSHDLTPEQNIIPTELKIVETHTIDSQTLPHPMKSASDIVRSRFQDNSPLRLFSISTEQYSRVNMVTDSINSGSLYGGVGTAMILAALLAESKKSRLRIITRTEAATTDNLCKILELNDINLTQDVEFIFAHYNDDLYEIDITDNELFITTSWWTTAATIPSVPNHSVIYLLQEDERMFYPYGDEHLRCSQVLSNKQIQFVVNSRLLYEHLVTDGFENIAINGIWFEPSFPRNVFFPRQRFSNIKKRLLFYARPNNFRNLFYFGVEVIEEAIKRGIIDPEIWDIHMVGKDIPDIIFDNHLIPIKSENLSWSSYAELIGKIDLGLCLMYTPHPSYPPLDIAASGAVVVTNRFKNKYDLGSYSKNIICGDLNQESMLSALAQGMRLVNNTKEREENFKSASLEVNWQLSFSKVIQHFSKVQ